VAHHKRKKPKSGRAGCLLCKPHKRQGVDNPIVQEKRARQDDQYSHPHRSRRKNTRLYCAGKVGKPHRPEWLKKRWAWKLTCQHCGKVLGHKWSSIDPKVIVMRGWEAFEGGPDESA